MMWTDVEQMDGIYVLTHRNRWKALYTIHSKWQFEINYWKWNITQNHHESVFFLISIHTQSKYFYMFYFGWKHFITMVLVCGLFSFFFCLYVKALSKVYSVLKHMWQQHRMKWRKKRDKKKTRQTKNHNIDLYRWLHNGIYFIGRVYWRVYICCCWLLLSNRPPTNFIDFNHKKNAVNLIKF